jgi:transposase
MDRHLDRLGQLNQEVEERLKGRTRDDAQWLLDCAGLPGVGDVTAWTSCALKWDFDRFRSGKQLARFCGLTPRNASSGARQADAGLIHACNKVASRRVDRSPVIGSSVTIRATWHLARQLRARGKAGSVIAATWPTVGCGGLYHEMKTCRAA